MLGHSVAETARRLGDGQQRTFSEAISCWEGLPLSIFQNRCAGGELQSSEVKRLQPREVIRTQ